MGDYVAPPSEHPDDECMAFARSAFEHRECRSKAEKLLGGDVTVAPHPLTGSDNVVCGHGVRYWLAKA